MKSLAKMYDEGSAVSGRGVEDRDENTRFVTLRVANISGYTFCLLLLSSNAFKITTIGLILTATY
jgi:hypothetical protein